MRGATRRRRGALAALVLASAAAAARGRTAGPALARPAASAGPIAPPPAGDGPATGSAPAADAALADAPAPAGERSDGDGGWWLGEQPARGALVLPELAGAGEGPPSVQLWPPAPVWPSWQGGRLRVEHGQLAPGATYRLEAAWPGGSMRRVTFRAAPLLEVIARGPEVGRVDPMAPVWARFGVDVDRDSVEASLRLTPPARGRIDWPDRRTVRFTPSEHLAWGDLHRVEVAGRTAAGEALPVTVWKFRPLIPPPLAVTPGEGAPVVFTFDDGTHDMTQAWRLLDLLRQHEVRAILFPTGTWTRAHPDYVERALREGHRVCNHSATHAHLANLTDDRIADEIRGGAGHGQCDLLRPPAMATSPRVERVAASLGYRMYFWHVDSRDWEGLHPDDLINRTLGRVRPGSVLLFHMHAPGTLDALPRLFVALRTAGYRLTHEGADREVLAAGGLPAGGLPAGGPPGDPAAAPP